MLSRGCIHAAGPYDVDHVRVRARAVATNTPPARRLPRLRGAAVALRARAPPRRRRARAWAWPPRSCGGATSSARGRRWPPGRSCATTSTWRRCSTARSRPATGTREARALRRGERARRPGEARDGARHVPARHGVHRLGREAPGVDRRRPRACPTGACACWPRAPRSARGRTPSSPRSPPTRSAWATTTSRWRRPTRATSPTAAPRWRRARAPSSASSSSRLRPRIKAQLLADGALTEPYDAAQLRAACARFVRERGALRATAQYEQPRDIAWDDERFRGDAYGAYSWAVYVAQVAVDATTYEARVEDFWALQEVGKVIHPLLAAGQIEGGVAQGIGWTLFENVVWKDGRMANDRMTDYIVPDERGRAAHPRALRGAPVRGRPARAPRASASCRWTGRRRPSSTPSPTPPA